MSKCLDELDSLKFLIDNYSNLEFDFTNIKKSLKALEIIKRLQKYYEEKLTGGGTIAIICDNKEEYDLLKEVLL